MFVLKYAPALFPKKMINGIVTAAKTIPVMVPEAFFQEFNTALSWESGVKVFAIVCVAPVIKE